MYEDDFWTTDEEYERVEAVQLPFNVDHPSINTLDVVEEEHILDVFRVSVVVTVDTDNGDVDHFKFSSDESLGSMEANGLAKCLADRLGVGPIRQVSQYLDYHSNMIDYEEPLDVDAVFSIGNKES